MRASVALFMLHLLALAPSAHALLGLGEKSAKWREEVVLRSGQALIVERSVTFGPDEWFRAGRGPLKKLSMSFAHSGRSIRWEAVGDRADVPAILDVVDGVPVIVAPVRGWFTCHRYEFPREGIVAWREERGNWIRMNAAPLEADLRVNLVQSFHDLVRDPPAKGLVVNAAWKDKLRGSAENRQGESISALSRKANEGEHACARLRPEPDPALQASGRSVALAERAARTVTAERAAFSTTSEPVSAADVRASLGRWMQAAWVSEECRDAVKQVEPRYRYEGDSTTMRSTLSGYTIHLTTRAGDARIALDGPQQSLVQVACDDRTLVVTRRSSADRLLIDRFDRAGALIDATWIQLPGASEVVLDSKSWPIVWSVGMTGDAAISIVLADYSYRGTMAHGGTLRRKATYNAILPPR